jgi:hypothetical protein
MKRIEVLGLKVDLNAKDATKQMVAMQKSITKQLSLLERESKDFDKGLGKIANHFLRIRKTTKPALADIDKSVGSLTESIEEAGKELEHYEQQLESASESEKDLFQQEIARWTKIRDVRKEAASGLGDIKRSIQDKFSLDVKGFTDAIKDGGQDLWEPFDKILGKDLPGAFESGGKLAGKLIEKTLRGTAAMTKIGGGLAKEFGKSLITKGRISQAKGGLFGRAKGAAQVAGGAALGGLGKFADKLGPLLSVISKIGPLISGISTVMVGLIKLFIDAEAAAKEFNKDILATAGSAGFLYSNFGSVQGGADELGDTLKRIRDDATSLDNMDWGINKDTHKAVLNSLTAEGVSLKRLNQEYANVAKSAESAEGHARSYGTTTQMNVAYSRLLGVALSEVSSLQAELMTELGMSVQGVEKQYSRIGRAAEEGGIASNKFFAIIRSVSADLSLYNSRMDETVNLLSMLGKVMSPRSAQKFLQTAMGAIKGMGRIQRLQVSLLAGTGKTQDVVQRDIGRTTKGIAEEIQKHVGGSIDDISKALTGSPEEIHRYMQQVPKEAQGAIREAITKLGIKKDMASKGVYGVGLAAGEVGPTAQLEIMQEALAKWGGGKTLRSGVGSIGLEQMSENLGVSRETLDQMIMLESAIDDQRAVLKSTLQHGSDEQKATLREQLTKLGVSGSTDAELIEGVSSAGYDQIMDSMDESARKQLEQGTKEIDYAKETAKYQTSLLDKIEVISEFFMNQMYNILSSIYDIFVDSTLFGNDQKRKERDLAKAVKESKSSDIAKLLSESGGDAYKFRGKLMESPEMGKFLASLESGTEDSQKVMRDFLTKAKPDELKQAIKDALGEGALYGGKDERAKYLELKQQADKFGLSGGSREDFFLRKGIREGGEANVSALSGEELEKVMSKLGWHMDPASFVKALGEAKTAAGTPVATPVDMTAMPRGAPPAAAQPAAPSGIKPAAMPEPEIPKGAASEEGQATMTTSIDDTNRALRKQGIVMDKSFLQTKYGRQIEDSMLEAMRQALYEYYLYKDLKVEDVSKAVQGGLPARELGAGLAGKLMEGVMPEEAITQLTGNAVGGMVTSIRDGIASVQPAPGEGLASIGKGERIVSAGAGSGVVTVRLELENGLEKFVRAKASDVYYENERARVRT